jgi:hypothetical protein
VTLRPFRVEQEFCIAARDADHAAELWRQACENLPPGVTDEGGALEAMAPEDVVADSPLAALLNDGVQAATT